MVSAIKVPTGEVVGIGKLKVFPTEKFQHEIPTFSFLVAKSDDGRFVASCLQMVTDGEGDSEEEAIKSMERGCLGYLKTIFDSNKIDPWDMLRELFNEPLEEYWSAYKTMQVNLAEKGINTDFQAALEKQIQQLTEELNMYKKNKKSLQLKIVLYQKKVA
ncbi:MAG: hypothetical protein HDR34_01675 [Treponema sp.]|nr:hypothetical protein [Treponema sp.]